MDECPRGFEPHFWYGTVLHFLQISNPATWQCLLLWEYVESIYNRYGAFGKAKLAEFVKPRLLTPRYTVNLCRYAIIYVSNFLKITTYCLHSTFYHQDGRVVKALDLSSNGRMSAWVRTPLLVGDIFWLLCRINDFIITEVYIFLQWKRQPLLARGGHFLPPSNKQITNLSFKKKDLKSSEIYSAIDKLTITRMAEWLRRWT